METLIIPDIHNHFHNAAFWLREYPADRVIFLGDFFDDFGDTPADVGEVAYWLSQRMEEEHDDVFLLGNHDAPYAFPDLPDTIFCPGWTPQKNKAVAKHLHPEHWARFQLAVEEQGWLLSHAGFHHTLGKTKSELLARAERAMRNARAGIDDPLFNAGYDRGGLAIYGGPTWMDWQSLMPIPGVDQIVGHSPAREPRKKTTLMSKNYCLDVNNCKIAGMLTNGQFSLIN